MKALRTPDDRFADLAGYPFAPHHAEVPHPDGGTLRMHYVDEGPADAEQEHVTIEGAGHFLQKDAPDALASAVLKFAADNPL